MMQINDEYYVRSSLSKPLLGSNNAAGGLDARVCCFIARKAEERRARKGWPSDWNPPELRGPQWQDLPL